MAETKTSCFCYKSYHKINIFSNLNKMLLGRHIWFIVTIKKSRQIFFCLPTQFFTSRKNLKIEYIYIQPFAVLTGSWFFKERNR